MKFLTFVFILTVISSSTSSLISSEEYGETLNEVYEDVDGIIKRDALNKDQLSLILDSIDRDCVKEKLNFTQNSDKHIDGFYGTFLIYSAFQLCAVNQDEVFSAHYEKLLSILSEDYRENLECFKQKLHQLEPNAAIQEYTAEASPTINEKECKIVSDRLKNLLTAGEDVDNIFCGSLTDADIEKFAYRLPILKFDTLDLSLKNSESENMIQKLSKIMENMYQCLMKKIE